MSSASTTNGHATQSARPAGLQFARTFSHDDIDPFDEVAWERRTAEIKGDDGKLVFTQDVEVPAAWSQLATNVVASKYFYGDASGPNGQPEAGGREDSVRQLVGRVARTIADWGIEDGYFASDDDGDRFGDELAWLCLNQHGSFNSPVWFNVGLSQAYGIAGAANGWRWEEKHNRMTGERTWHGVTKCQDAYLNPQASACFLQSVTDDMEAIGDLVKSEMMLFKGGSGTGTDLSPLRSCKEKLTGGGKPSGPISFMEVYDAAAGVIKSGGRSRRSAKMQILRCDHPDIVDYIECKAKEEAKAKALIAAGYPDDFNGEAYRSIKFQNANLSVSFTDECMRKSHLPADDPAGEFGLVARTTGEVIETIHAATLLDKAAEATWGSGDPGAFFVDTINRWHTCPNSGPITTANPCGEYLFVDDSACNLSSLNLMKFRRPDGSFDHVRYRAACRIFITAQEILVDRASYPTEKIARNSHDFRPLGLGNCGLGGLIMASGLPYDSDEGRSLAALVTAIMTGEAYRTSAEIAANKGAFPGFAANRESMLRVMGMHREALRQLDSPRHLDDLHLVALDLWDEAIASGTSHGYRNAQATLYAPTGTIAFAMDSGHSTGLEPSIALTQYKTLSGGGVLKITNPVVPMALKTLGYDDPTIARIEEHVAAYDTIEDVSYAGHNEMQGDESGLDPAHLAVFDCAFPSPNGSRSIAWQGHVKMLAAIQPFISGSSSKTVNMPADSTVADIKGAFQLAWKLGVKDVAIYRDGSKSQPVSTKKGGDTSTVAEPTPPPTLDPVAVAPSAPRRERLPDTRRSLTHKLSVGGVEAYATVGLYPDGRPGELFVEIAKEGSTVGGLMDAWATGVSIGLQYGVPLGVLVDKFSGGRFEPAGMTRNADIPIAKSLIDYIARWMGMEFIKGYREEYAPDRGQGGDAEAAEGINEAPSATPSPRPSTAPRGPVAHAEVCPKCGGLGTPTGSCWTCMNCGTSIGGCG